MSQNDFNIANQGFPATRADINSALQALASNSAGTAEPSTTYAYQFWYDETNELLKMRNSDNDAWITIGTFDQTGDTFTPAGVTTDKIEEGNSSVEVVDTGTGYVAITVDGVEAARVTSGGNVGIGTSSPSTELEVAGTGDGSGAVVTIADTGSIGLEIQSNNPTLLFRENDTTDQNYQLRLQGGSLTFQTQNDARSSASEVMRLDQSGNLKFNSGYGSVQTAYGCRAWVNFNGTGTVAIRESGNVSSITDIGTGNYTVNFTNAMPDANYAAFMMQWDSTGGANQLGMSQATTNCNFRTRDSSDQETDNSRVTVGVFR